MKNTQIAQQNNSGHQREGSIYEILFSLPVWIYLPVRIDLWLQPNKTLLSSVEEPVKLYISPQELQTIEASITQQHITIEAALIEYLKLTMQRYKKWQELVIQVHQRYGNEAQVTLEVKLLGHITWSESL